MQEYVIRIIGTYDILLLSPEMIALLIEKIRQSDMRELIIPAEELIPQEYAEYLTRVLQINAQFFQSSDDREDSYRLVSGQLNALYINNAPCFEQVSYLHQSHKKIFDLNTTEGFYLLTKQSHDHFQYAYTGPDGKEIRLSLIYQQEGTGAT